MNGKAGFSLIEVLIALAIMAFVSAALLQSSTQWLRLSARAADAAQGSAGAIADQRMFAGVIAGLVYGWPDSGEDIFSGAPDGFSGLTLTPMSGARKLSRFRIALSPGAPTELIYSESGIDWTLAEIDGPAAEIAYLGEGGVWSPTWPPRSADDRLAAFQAPMQLPHAVRIVFNRGGETLVWTAATAGAPSPPERIQDYEARR